MQQHCDHGPREESCFLTSINPSRIERSPIFKAIILKDLLYKILSCLGAGHYRTSPLPLKSVHVKKCYSDVTSMLWENIRIKLMCTAMWLKGMDRCSNGQRPKWSKFYVFSPLLPYSSIWKKGYILYLKLFSSQAKQKLCMLQNIISICISETPLTPLIL